jgi:hypothetical protein
MPCILEDGGDRERLKVSPMKPTPQNVADYLALREQKALLERQLREVDKTLEPLTVVLRGAVAEHGGKRRRVTVGSFVVRLTEGQKFPKWKEVYLRDCGVAQTARVLAETIPKEFLVVEKTGKKST